MVQTLFVREGDHLRAASTQDVLDLAPAGARPEELKRQDSGLIGAEG